MAIDLLKAEFGDLFETYDGNVYGLHERKGEKFIMKGMHGKAQFTRDGKRLPLGSGHDLARTIERQGKESV